MKQTRSVKSERKYMGRMPFGCDLLDELTKFCIRNDIRLGRVEALGAVKKARMGFYDQAKKTYHFHTISRPLEILNLIGNVSLKDGKPFVHAHVTLADKTGRAFGGHLTQGTIVFACEFVIEEFSGPLLRRQPDSRTGLALWEKKKEVRIQ